MDDFTMETYERRRREIAEANADPLGVVLNEKEKKLDGLLTRLKAEYRESCGGRVPYHVPVLTDTALTGSRLYRFCTQMPKGADLHVHDLAELPHGELVKLLLTREEFYINTVDDAHDLIRVFPGAAVPEGYRLFREALESGAVTREALLQSWTVLGAEKHGAGIWDWFEELFVRHAVLSGFDDFAKDFYDYTFRYYISRGIYHIEVHLLLMDEPEEAASYIRALREAYYHVKREYPFFYCRIIGAGLKADNDRLETARRCFFNTLYAQENIRDEFDPEHISDFVIGFDLINEEDSTMPLREFAPLLLKARKLYPRMRLFIHGGESLEAKNDNLIDAYLLGVSRVGHGLNLYRFPELLERYADSEICLEVCVISNQTLGYTRDIRNHPAVEYLRRGVAVALCSDDPTYQENETLTDDFFAAAVCWDLTVADLKQLTINSIRYSGLEEYDMRIALRHLREAWDEFTDRALKEY